MKQTDNVPQAVSNALELLIRAGKVKRWHQMPDFPSQTNAEHQYNAAMIYIILATVHKIGISPHALVAVLTHDVHELYSGDCAGPEKTDMYRAHEEECRTRFFKELDMNDPMLDQSLTATERQLIRLCDAYEQSLYIGNLKCSLKGKEGLEAGLRSVEKVVIELDKLHELLRSSK